MSAPTSDESAIRLTIRALRAAGYSLQCVDDGEEEVKVRTEAEALEAITAVDSAHLYLTTSDGEHAGWVWFVLGNEPFEVVSDHTLTLSHALDPLLESWW
jgi:hypothetical protein